MMNRHYSRFLSLAVLLAALPGFSLGAAGHTAVGGSIAGAPSHSDAEANGQAFASSAACPD
jgi:hypothetical protein